MIFIYTHTRVCIYTYVLRFTAILIIFEGRFQVFQQFSSGKLVFKDVEIRFAALNYYENGSMYWSVFGVSGANSCKKIGSVVCSVMKHECMYVCTV